MKTSYDNIISFSAVYQGRIYNTSEKDKNICNLRKEYYFPT